MGFDQDQIRKKIEEKGKKRKKLKNGHKVAVSKLSKLILIYQTITFSTETTRF